MLARLQYAAETTAQRAALGIAGTLALLVGLGFLSLSAWMAIRLASDALTANLILGAAFFGLGLILMVWSRAHRRYRRPIRTAGPPAVQTSGIASAFMQGFGAGLSARR